MYQTLLPWKSAHLTLHWFHQQDNTVTLEIFGRLGKYGVILEMLEHLGNLHIWFCFIHLMWKSVFLTQHLCFWLKNCVSDSKIVLVTQKLCFWLNMLFLTLYVSDSKNEWKPIMWPMKSWKHKPSLTLLTFQYFSISCGNIILWLFTPSTCKDH